MSASLDEADLRGRLFGVLNAETDRLFGAGSIGSAASAYSDSETVEFLNILVDTGVRRASEDRLSEDDAIVAEETLRAILAIAARWQSERAGLQYGVVSVEALNFSLGRLCPIWPFC